MRAPDPVFVSAAQTTHAKYGLLASVSLAQWAQESAWGEKTTGEFNYFGIKGLGTLCDTHEDVADKSILIKASFRDFTSVQDCFNYRAVFFATSPRFRPAWIVRHDYEAFCRQLRVCGYATDPNYDVELIRLIQEEGFLKYD